MAGGWSSSFRESQGHFVLKEATLERGGPRSDEPGSGHHPEVGAAGPGPEAADNTGTRVPTVSVVDGEAGAQAWPIRAQALETRPWAASTFVGIASPSLVVHPKGWRKKQRSGPAPIQSKAEQAKLRPRGGIRAIGAHTCHITRRAGCLCRCFVCCVRLCCFDRRCWLCCFELGVFMIFFIFFHDFLDPL